jgi:cobalamin biosynthesis Mg chelatase CobN
MSEPVGDCTPCKNGTYSATVDSRQCQICRSEKCFEHQVIEGTCLANRRDETYCIEKCVNGYVINKEGTACEVLTPQQNTTEKPTNNLTTTNPTTTNPTTSNPTTTNPTTGTTNPTTMKPTTMKPTTMKPTRNPKTKKLPTNNHAINTITTKKPVVSNKRKETMNVPLIVVIVIAIVFFVIILAIMFKFVWPRLKALMQTREPQGRMSLTECFSYIINK